MLVTNPAHRATVSEIIIHPWINKGYDGPVDNYLPDRIPLTLPLDMEVIRGMTGFEFGTENEIRDKLQEIITSNEYQRAAKILVDRTAETHRNHRQSHLVSRFSPHSNRKSFILPNEDPQSIPAAYHPLVSIYYLVKERLERESRLNAAAASPTTTSSSSASIRIPNISLPDQIHPPDRISLEDDNTTATIAAATAYTSKGKASIKLEKEPTHKPLFHRKSSFSSSSSSSDQEGTTHHSHNVLRRLSLALSRPSTEKGTRSRKHSSNTSNNSVVGASVSTPIQIPSRDTFASKYPNARQTQHEPTDLDIATAAAAAASAATTASTSASNNTFGNKISKILPRRMTLGQSSMNAENHTNFLNMVNGGNHQQQAERRLSTGKGPINSLPLRIDCKKPATAAAQHDHEQSFPSPLDGSSGYQQKGTADENIKPVFLKGLFSVTTTSTKHPSVIRADLIKVLERIGVKWRESKGRFECVHMPSIDLNKVVNEETEDHYSFSSEDATQAAVVSNTTASIVPVPDLVVRFEIYIVKVPWLLGMHGLQFRRVGGDPWQYKNMCSKILAELKL